MSLGKRKGLPLLLAGLGLFAYLALSPRVPHERNITYRYPAPGRPAELEVRWSEANGPETVGTVRFAVTEAQRQSSHTLLLADGDYLVEAELPDGASKTRKVHVDTNALSVVFE